MELKPVRTDDQASAGRGVTYESTHDVAATESGRRVLRNVYLLLAASLVPTAIGALLGANLDLSFLRASPIISSFAILGIFYGWIFAIEKNKTSGLGVGLLLGFTAFMGVLMGPLLQAVLGLANGVQLVAMAAGGTAAALFGLARVGGASQTLVREMGHFVT